MPAPELLDAVSSSKLYSVGYSVPATYEIL